MIHLRTPLAIVSLTAFFVICSGGKTEGNLSVLGSALLTDVVDLDLHGDRVLGAFTGGVVLIDVSDPSVPLMKGYLSTHEPCSDCILTDYLAFAACGSQGILIIDAADTLGMSPLSTISTDGSAEGIFLAFPYLYVATSGYGLEMFDVTDPRQPLPVADLFLAGSPSEVWVADSTAFLSDTSMKLWMIDVSEPGSPSVSGVTATRGLAKDVTSMDGLVILAEYDVGITSYDVSDPDSIFPVDGVDTPGRALDLFLDPPRLYLADDFGGTHLFTVNLDGIFHYISTMPSLVPSEDVRGVSSRNDTVLIGEDMTGVLVVDWSDTLSPQLIGLYDVPGHVRGARITGQGFLAVAEGSRGFRTLRMKEGGTAEYLSLLELPGGASSIEVADTLAFIASSLVGTGVNIVDIADPEAPRQISNVSTGRVVLESRYEGGLLYAVDGDFKVIDVSNPSLPQLVGSLITTDAYSNDLFVVSAARIYIANGDSGLFVVDATFPDDPVYSGAFRTGGYVQGVHVLNNEAFVADSDSGLIILDVTDPSHIEKVGTAEVGGTPLEVVVSGNRAFLSMEEGAVVEVDVSDITQPHVTARYETPDMSVDLWISSDTLVVSDRTSLILLRAESVDVEDGDDCTANRLPVPLLSQNYPNPFNPMTTITVDRDELWKDELWQEELGANRPGKDEPGVNRPGHTGAMILIYDIRGRLVNELPVPPGHGEARITWDGRNRDGTEVRSGVYLYRVESAGEARKMLLLR